MTLTPKQLGYRQPAEWTAHEAVWLAWPSHPDEWLGDLAGPRRSVADMAAAIADVSGGRPRGEELRMLVLDDAGEASAQDHLGNTPAVFHHIPFGDVWLRDTAPIFVTGPEGIAAVCCDFNGWGGKYLFEHDPEVRARVARAAGVRCFELPWILEGGAIEVDGAGTALTTRQCLLAQNRNPHMSAADIEHALSESLGLDRVLWLDEGLANDHTDGHIDTLARFVAPGVVVCMEPRDGDDPNRDVLRAIAADLARFRDAAGRRLEVVCVPSPGRIEGAGGQVLPASYVNFYIGNSAVVVPTYRSPHDEAALTAIAELFPDRRTVGVDAAPILDGGGAFHCITQQQPRRPT